MKDLYRQIAVILLVIGGLNWGLFGLFGFNLVTAIFGNLLGRLILVAIGVAAGYLCYLYYQSKFKRITN